MNLRNEIFSVLPSDCKIEFSSFYLSRFSEAVRFTKLIENKNVLSGVLITLELSCYLMKPDVKCVSKVRVQLCDSRKLYIASVTIIQRAGNSTPQIK